MKKDNPYDQKYAGQEYYWGKKPSAICDRIVEIIRPCPDFHPKLLDLGCGEGRNAIYFAKHGFDVTALDVSLPGLEKMKKYAEEVGVKVKIIQANIITYEIEEEEFPNDPALQQVHIARKIIAKEAESEGLSFIGYVKLLRKQVKNIQ